MRCHTMSKEEKEYLANYNIASFDRPSIVTDIAIFSILNEGCQDNIRKLQKKSLKILLIKRGSYPYKGCWSLPGGFCKKGEEVIEAARRELREETNVKNAYLQLIGVYGDKNRDPRGWIISNTFMALMDGETCDLKAGTDAWEARWFQVKVNQKEKSRVVTEGDIRIETEYEICLTNEELGLFLGGRVVEKKHFHNYHESLSYEIVNEDNLAFDHCEIILHGVLCLRKKTEFDFKIVFDLMPELFTLSQLQNAFEVILDQKLIAANFRRKITDYVIETDLMLEGVGFRPAKLFKRNINMFYHLN